MEEKYTQIKRIWSEIRWLFLGAFWVFSLILGYIGVSNYAIDNGLDFSITERIYRSLQLISMNSGAVDGNNNWIFDLARFLLPALTAYALLQAVLNLFREQMQFLQLWGLKDHIIICGLGRKGGHLVDDLLHHNKRLLVIQNDIDPIIANEYRKKGVFIFDSDPGDTDTLKSARITEASHLVCFLGDDQKNLNIAHKAYDIVQNNTNHKLICIVHLTSQELLNLVRISVLRIKMDDPFILETFNIYEQMSHQLINNDPAWQISSQNLPSTLLILGFGRLGQNLCRQVAYTWYRDNYEEKRTMIIIDQQAHSKVELFINSIPRVKAVCNLIPIQTDLSYRQNLQDLIKKQIEHKNIDHAYVCLGNPVLSLQVGLSLQEIPELTRIPIQLRLENESGLTGVLENPIPGLREENNIKPFDIYEQTFSSDLVFGGFHEIMAIKLHKNFLQNLNTAEHALRQDIPWESVPEAEKEANRQQASRIHLLLKSCGYNITTLEDWDAADFTFAEEEVDQMARQEHDLWRQWKQTNGWHLGETRDDLEKTNPDLIPWEKIPEIERQKNRNFIREIPSLLAGMGFQIDKVY